MTFKEKKSSNLLISLLAIIVLGAIVFLFVSPMFEKKPPKIEFKNNGYWNLKDVLKVTLYDDSGIKYYKISAVINDKVKVLEEKVLDSAPNHLNINIKPPKFDLFFKSQTIQLKIEVIDNSKWNFLNGNKAIMQKVLKIDTKKPLISVIANSRYIKRGGSAIAIVKIQDENLVDKYIQFNQNRFELTPFIKPNYYIALLAWDINIKFEDFDMIKLVAYDKAGNKSVEKIPFYIQKLKIKHDNIHITDKFINNVSINVLTKMDKKIPNDPIKIFLAQNKDLRAQNIQTIRKVGIKNIPKDFVDDFYIYRFKRLRGSRTAAGFAEYRNYYYKSQKIDEEWHLGLDFASVRQAPIKVSNNGKVIFKDYLGIYGNTIIIDHGLGLCSLYAHTTDQFVNVGDQVKKGQKIATTGITGAVLGDHLHFGILVQGIEVNPIEWMDKNWIKTRILDIIKQAKQRIK